MLGSLLIAAVAGTRMVTDESFAIHDMGGPCRVKIEGKPPDNPPAACGAALTAATSAKEKAILYFTWAYSLNEGGAALQALPNVDKALALAPNFANARHERSYTFNDLGYYDRALLDSSRDIELRPDAPDAYNERAFARHRLADFEGSLADRLKVIELGDSSRGAALEVVKELMWLGRYDEAATRLGGLPAGDDDKSLRSELDRRRNFKPDGGEAKRCGLAQSVDDRSAAQKMVEDCTWAFDHEVSSVKRAEYLTTRSINSVVAFQDRDLSVPDLQIAAALDPKNPERHINYGFALIGVGHSWAAAKEFETALADSNLNKQDKALALAGRGQARENLGDTVGAFRDAKTSYEVEPLEPNVWLLGDLAFANGDKAAAKAFWMAAYHMGGADDSLIERLKSVGVDHPEKEPR